MAGSTITGHLLGAGLSLNHLSDLLGPPHILCSGAGLLVLGLR